MAHSHSPRSALVILALCSGCLPTRDLDATTRGAGGGNPAEKPGGTGAVGSGTGAVGNSDSVAGGTSPGVGGVAGTGQATGGAASTAGTSTTGGTAASTGSTGGASTGGIPTGGDGAIAASLPELTNSPVEGGLIHNDGASWDIDGTQVPVFEIHTPTASYWLLKSAAAIVALTDKEGRKWIGYDSSNRPNRGIPNLGGCCHVGDPQTMGLAEMTTTIDESAETFTHLRFVSRSINDNNYWLVWDFYQTHLTVTINRSQEEFGFTYHGVPGGNVGAEDLLGFASGETQSAQSAFAEDLPGPNEWVYLSSANGTANSSLFLIHHGDDSIPDRYGLAISDSSRFTFGGGELTNTPVRFSLGIVSSVDHATVSDRVGYVTENTIPP